MGEGREEDLGNAQLARVLGGESMWVLLRKAGYGTGEHLELTALAAASILWVCVQFSSDFVCFGRIWFLGLRGWAGQAFGLAVLVEWFWTLFMGRSPLKANSNGSLKNSENFHKW